MPPATGETSGPTCDDRLLPTTTSAPRDGGSQEAPTLHNRSRRRRTPPVALAAAHRDPVRLPHIRHTRRTPQRQSFRPHRQRGRSRHRQPPSRAGEGAEAGGDRQLAPPCPQRPGMRVREKGPCWEDWSDGLPTPWPGPLRAVRHRSQRDPPRRRIAIVAVVRDPARTWDRTSAPERTALRKRRRRLVTCPMIASCRIPLPSAIRATGPVASTNWPSRWDRPTTPRSGSSGGCVVRGGCAPRERISWKRTPHVSVEGSASAEGRRWWTATKTARSMMSVSSQLRRTPPDSRARVISPGPSAATTLRHAMNGPTPPTDRAGYGEGIPHRAG